MIPSTSRSPVTQRSPSPSPVPSPLPLRPLPSPSRPLPHAGNPSAATLTITSHSRSHSNVTLVDAAPPSSSKPTTPEDPDPEPQSPWTWWFARVLLPHLLPPLVSLGVILVVFPLTFLAGPSLSALAKIIISVGLAVQLCYACLHIASAGSFRTPRYQPLGTSPSRNATPARTLALAAVYVLRTLLPVLSWLTLFSLLKHMPADRMATVDTTSLPWADTWLVGRPAYEYFAPASDRDASVSVDVVAWFTYGVWHFVSPVACCLVLGFVGVRRVRKQLDARTVQEAAVDQEVMWDCRPRSSFDHQVEAHTMTSPDATDVDSDSDDTLSEVIVVSNAPPAPQPLPPVTPRILVHKPTTLTARLATALSSPALIPILGPIHTFLTCFGCMNLCGVMIQYVFPTAPPWYNQHFGYVVPANPLAVHGDPAGLSRIDALLGAPIYKRVFASSPVVFGAWPSLHAGFATMCALSVASSLWSNRGRVWNAAVAVAGVAYVGLVWWATMYLRHHFLVDVVAGSAIAFVMYVCVGWVKARRVLAGKVGNDSRASWAQDDVDEVEAAQVAAMMATGLWAVPARGDGRQRRGTGASDVTLV
ncbi:hypothetical protein BCR44DRAFT_1330087 [Catenaria anguillulae PL171]|uniref:Phosphatidic acid phosphatase type 2/haloperoxidase domain-containing protein n=1 Tax=Catenaria anguillulae PL171 TaxID=765915 RepID=A0A1Y2H6H5_9FUNG|nr:hypothetical protein BCR44DRAFT_1330087 [Catenaria anguillulae PL171]